MNKRLLLIPAGLSMLLLTTAGSCDTAHESAPDVPKEQIVQLNKIQAIQMPEGFRNLVFGCIPGSHTEVFMTSRGSGSSLDPAASSVAVVENASYCGGTIAASAPVSN